MLNQLEHANYEFCSFRKAKKSLNILGDFFKKFTLFRHYTTTTLVIII